MVKIEKISDYGKPQPTSNEAKLNIQKRIDRILFRPAAESHIKLNPKACMACQEKPCLLVCPAGMFSLSGDGQEVIYSHEGCLECGTCYVVCSELSWQYPEGGFGVIYRES